MGRDFPVIKSVKAFCQKNEQAAAGADYGADCHDVGDDHWIDGSPIPVANPMSWYAQYAASRKSWGINALGTMVVEIKTIDGQKGYGVTIAGEPGCFIVENHLSRFIEGQDPRNIEKMWDQMYRSSINYGRKGLTIQAISAVDLALWDLLGKVREEPVFALLGGQTKPFLPVYTTTARPDIAKEKGFIGAKLACPYGPASGDWGLDQNECFFANWRSKVGDKFPLALDCYMSMTVPYAIKLGNRLKKHNLKWMEEFLPPDQYDGYREVYRAMRGNGIMLTTGEHEYTRYGYRQLLEPRCVDILQPDVTWCGGITEARRVVAMASAQDVLVIPHGSSVFSYHLQYAYPSCPIAEFINLSPKADQIVPYFGSLFEDEPLPEKGKIRLSDKPGFGLTLNSKVSFRRPYEREPLSDENLRKLMERDAQYDQADPVMTF